jgi:hypothetical protein
MANEAKSRRRAEALAIIMKSQTLMAQVNPQWLLSEALRAGFDEADVRLATSKDPGNLDQLSKASEAIQQILKGKKPKLIRRANAVFLQKILDFAMDHEDEIEPEQFNALMAYLDAHKRFAVENTVRQGLSMNTQRKENMARSTIGLSENLQMPERDAGSPLNPAISGNKASALLTGKANPAEMAV